MVHLEMGLHVVLVSFPAAATVKDSITDRTLISIVVVVVIVIVVVIVLVIVIVIVVIVIVVIVVVVVIIVVGHSLQHKRSFCLISYSFPPRTFSLDVLYFHFGGEKT